MCKQNRSALIAGSSHSKKHDLEQDETSTCSVNKNFGASGDMGHLEQGTCTRETDTNTVTQCANEMRTTVQCISEPINDDSGVLPEEIDETRDHIREMSYKAAQRRMHNFL